MAEKEDKSTLKAYVKSAQNFNGKLHVRGTEDKGREVGRSAKAERKLEADDAEYIEFEFDNATPMSRVTKWTLYASAK